MKIQMDEESPFACKYFCEKCNKTLRDRFPATFVKHTTEVHMVDSNGADSIEFGRDVCALFMARVLFFLSYK